MTLRHVVVIVLCVVLVGLPIGAAQQTPTTGTNATDEAATEQRGLGTQLTAFAQSSSAAANDSVENGMWRAGFDQANQSQRAELVTDRTDSLEQRLARLRDQNTSLRARYENGTLPEQAYVAQQSRLSARIDALRTAVNDTDDAATQAGVNDTRLETLKQNASQLTGPQVAAVARGLAGGPSARRGPPSERGPPTNQSDQQGTAVNQSDERRATRGPPMDRPDPRGGSPTNQSRQQGTNATGSSNGDSASNPESGSSSGNGGEPERTQNGAAAENSAASNGTGNSNSAASTGTGNNAASNGDTSTSNGNNAASNGDTSTSNGDSAASNGDTSTSNGDSAASNSAASSGSSSGSSNADNSGHGPARARGT